MIVPTTDTNWVSDRLFSLDWAARPFFFLLFAAALCTIFYSVPVPRLGRLKEHWCPTPPPRQPLPNTLTNLFRPFNLYLEIIYIVMMMCFKKTMCHAIRLGSNLAIATARGLLLKVAGWATVAPINYVEPWLIGGIFFLFLLFGASTKDFGDMAGDFQFGCVTLPLRWGARSAIVLVGISLITPWLLLIMISWASLLSSSKTATTLLVCLSTVILSSVFFSSAYQH